MNFYQIQLTCADRAEADKIAKVLLNKHLVACAKQIPISSDFHWQGKIENAKEILLIMESREDLFDKIDAEVAQLHSYDTFVLLATPITKISQKAQTWLNNEIA